MLHVLLALIQKVKSISKHEAHDLQGIMVHAETAVVVLDEVQVQAFGFLQRRP